MRKVTFTLVLLFVMLTASFALAQERPRLGLSAESLVASQMLQRHLQISEGEGIVVKNIVVDSALDKAGIVQGDIILSVDGISLSSPSDLISYIQSTQPNQKITLEVICKGERQRLNIQVDNLPDEIVWKYGSTVTSPGRTLSPFQPQQRLSQQMPSQGFSSSQRMTFRSQVRTDKGFETSSVTITGDPQDENSDIEIELADQSYRGKIKDVPHFPEVARKAAQDAIQQSNMFQFGSGMTFGTFMPQDMDEFFRQQMEEMQRVEEMFFRRRAPSGQPGQANPPSSSPIHMEDNTPAPQGNRL